MAKTMAQIVDGVVVNILWCSDHTVQSEMLVDLADRPVCIGNTYSDGTFYRDGIAVMTPLEEALAKIASLKAEKADMQAALEMLGVNADE